MKAINLFVLLLTVEVSFSQNAHVTEQLTYNTIRIETENAMGTGFFFNFKVETDSLKYIPTIITNRHVVDGSKKILLYFRKSLNGQAQNGTALVFEIPNTTETVIQHPNPKIDLVAIPIASILQQLQKKRLLLIQSVFRKVRYLQMSFRKKS